MMWSKNYLTCSISIFSYKNLFLLSKRTLLFLLSLAFFPLQVFPSTAENNSFKIIKHSKLQFTLYQEDTVKLQIIANGSNLKYLWKKNGEVICQDNACTFDSSKWSVGTHFIDAQVFNEYGHAYLPYIINIIKNPISTPQKELDPPLVLSRNKIKYSYYDKLFIKTVTNGGFVKRKGTTRLIDLITPIMGNSQIWTDKAGIIQIATQESEEHYLLPSTTIAIEKQDNSDQYSIHFKKGILRTRQIKEAEPKWNILIANHLQITGDQKSDFIVQYNPKSKSLFLIQLRGKTTISNKTSDHINSEQKSDNNKKNFSLAVIAGETLRLTKENIKTLNNTIKSNFNADIPIIGSVSNLEKTSDIIAMTTPQYYFQDFLSTAEKENSPFKKASKYSLPIKQNLISTPLTTIEMSLPAAKKSLEDNDSLQALSLLEKFKENALKNADVAMTIAMASKNILLFAQARSFFDLAIKLNPNDPLPHFSKGKMLVALKHCEEAIKHLNNAYDLQYTDQQSVYYYLGLCNQDLSNKHKAFRQFTYGFWDEKDNQITELSKKQLAQLENNSKFDILLKTSGIYNDNILAGDKSIINKDITAVNKDYGYTLSGFINYYPQKKLPTNKNLSWHITYFLDSKQYSSPLLQYMNLINNYVAMPLSYKVGYIYPDNINNDIIKISLIPFIRTDFLAFKSHLNTYGIQNRVEILSLWGTPAITYESSWRIDPYPNGDNIYDSTLDETAAPTDRSNKFGAFFLDLNIANLHKIDIWLHIASGVTSFKALQSGENSFVHTRYQGSLLYNRNLRARFNTSFSFLSKKFYNAEDLRSDSKWSLSSSFEWYYFPEISQFVVLQIENQNSTRSQYTFKRNQASIGFNFKL
ncbi:MAG: hypothetical protein R3B45_07410 [Bdellovibrionota bacterium]